MAAFAEAAAASPPLPVTDHLADSLLALPMGAHVSAAVAGRVADEVRQIIARGRQVVSA